MEMTVSCSATILSQSVFVRSMRLILFHVSSAGILFCAHACSPATKDEPTSDNFALLRQRAKMVRGGREQDCRFHLARQKEGGRDVAAPSIAAGEWAPSAAIDPESIHVPTRVCHFIHLFTQPDAEQT